MQGSMWNQYLVQLLTHNPKSINAKVFRTLRTTKKVLLDFLMYELVDVVPLLCTSLQKLKIRMMRPWFELFPENIGLPENLWILRLKMNLLWTSLQTNLRNKHFVWKSSTLILSQYQNVKCYYRSVQVFIEFLHLKSSRYKLHLIHVCITTQTEN